MLTVIKIIFGFYTFMGWFSVLFNGWTNNNVLNIEIGVLYSATAILLVMPKWGSGDTAYKVFLSGLASMAVIIQLHFLGYRIADNVSPSWLLVLVEGPLVIALLLYLYELVGVRNSKQT